MEVSFLSVIPPLVTIVLALLLKNVFIALLIGIFLSTFILADFNLFTGINDMLYSIVRTFESNGNTIVLLCMFLIGALIYMIERTGGIVGFVDVMVKQRGIIKSKRSSKIFTWLLGIFVFTSGSLSCMVTGSVARPLNDSMKVPHEKAAFLVHTTSTPWCVLFPLSGWLASMAGYIASGGVPEEESVSILFQSIPYNFYCILAVVFALLVALFPLDFGSMKKAEMRADATGELDDPETLAKAPQPAVMEETDITPRAKNMFIPMLVMIITILAVLAYTGNGNPTKGNGMQSLLWGCSLSLFTISFMSLVQRVFTLDKLTSELMKGMSTMLPIAAVLLFGLTMGSLVKSLQTGIYLSSYFEQFLTPALLPVLTFILAMILSFSTGTSMGTMAIVSVISLPMALEMNMHIPLVAGAIFGGAIFGDHASPISDTTIMSCATTGCNVIDHVKTQLPYVSVFAIISIILYTIMGFII